MNSILAAAAAAVVGFGLGAVTVGWVAGIIPALLFFGLTFFLISRHMMGKLQAVSLRVQQKLQVAPPPEILRIAQTPEGQRSLRQWQAKHRDEVRAILREMLVWERWQFLVRENVEGQLGMLSYQEGIESKMTGHASEAITHFERARGHLVAAWHPQLSGLMGDWRSRAMLAAVHMRLTKLDEAVGTMKESEAAGQKEPFFWGFYALLLLEAKKPEEAMAVVGRGLSAGSSPGLVAMQAALTNRQKPDMGKFGDIWYQFFPEDIPMERRMEMAREAGMDVPDPAKMSGAPGKGANRPISPKTFPHPRR